jgi:two-component system, NarL family, response regulator NreC
VAIEQLANSASATDAATRPSPHAAPAGAPQPSAGNYGTAGRSVRHAVAMNDETTVVIADDHAVVRKGLRMLVDAEPALRVVAEAGTVPDALRMARAHRPSVLVLDLNMPGGSSLESIPTIREQAPMTAIVVLTMQNDPAFARQALQAGALGFVLKEAADDELLEAIRLAAEGETYLNPRLGARLAAQPPQPAGPPDDLSEREVEVLKLIALGHTNAEIAGQLYLSVRTVESHRAHIQQKTRRSSRAELVKYAIDNGLVEV